MTYFKFVTCFILCQWLMSLPAYSKAQLAPYYSNIIDVSSEHLSVDFWTEQLAINQSSTSVLLSSKQIDAYNQDQFDAGTFLTDPLSYPERLLGKEVESMILSISKPSSAKRFYKKDQLVTQADYQNYHQLMAIDELAEQTPVQFALVLRRTALRTFPTSDRVFNDKLNTDIDRFQESALFPGEALAVLHFSRDKQWTFVQNYHYRAWVKTDDIAFGAKQKIADYIGHKQRLVVTGAKVLTAIDPKRPALSELQLDMGVELPLLTHQAYGKYELSGQNPLTSYIVLMPAKDNQGRLTIVPTLIPRSADVSIGYLPLTKENLLKQSFKFLGERYGWGHDFNGRDCSGFIGEIFKVFGLSLPRNSDQQSDATIGLNQRFTSKEITEDKLFALSKLAVGDLIYLSGHVVMVIGFDQNQPYVIHDVYDLNYQNKQGDSVTGILNGVSVTPLMPFKGYIQKMYNIKRFR